jgi:hypothetical protein
MLLPDAEGLAAESTTVKGSPQRDVSTNDTGAFAPEAGELMPSVTLTWPPGIVNGCSFRSTRACWTCSRYSAHCSAVDWNCPQRMSVWIVHVLQDHLELMPRYMQNHVQRQGMQLRLLMGRSPGG